VAENPALRPLQKSGRQCVRCHSEVWKRQAGPALCIISEAQTALGSFEPNRCILPHAPQTARCVLCLGGLVRRLLNFFLFWWALHECFQFCELGLDAPFPEDLGLSCVHRSNGRNTRC